MVFFRGKTIKLNGDKYKSAIKDLKNILAVHQKELGEIFKKIVEICR